MLSVSTASSPTPTSCAAAQTRSTALASTATPLVAAPAATTASTEAATRRFDGHFMTTKATSAGANAFEARATFAGADVHTTPSDHTLNRSAGAEGIMTLKLLIF